MFLASAFDGSIFHPAGGTETFTKSMTSKIWTRKESPSRDDLGYVAVVGAGVSGLAAAYRLQKEGARVAVFDSNGVGGTIQSYSKDGYIWERGANTMAENSPVIGELIEELKLEDRRLLPREQKNRYIVRNGKPELLPSGPISFLTSKLLTTPAKLRILAEPFLWKRRSTGPLAPSQSVDESLGSFLERHIGVEPVEYLADPFCSGTAGSDPYSLSVKLAFPQLWDLEQSHGSLIVGALAKAMAGKGQKGAVASSKKKTRGSFSFAGGMQTLPNAMADAIGRENLHLGAPVTELACTQTGPANRVTWNLKVCSEGGKKPAMPSFDAVLVTAPLHCLSEVRVVRDGDIYEPCMPPVVYQPMSMIINAFKTEHVQRPLPGFGVLVPSKEQRMGGIRSIGTLFSSAMFADRAPPGHTLFTTFVGGSRNRDLALRPFAEVQALVLKDLRHLLGAEGPPVFTQYVCWQKAFPEYGASYGSVLKAIEKVERDLPGLYYAGNHKGGLAVGKALMSGYEAAGLIADRLRSISSTSTEIQC